MGFREYERGYRRQYSDVAPQLDEVAIFELVGDFEDAVRVYKAGGVVDSGWLADLGRWVAEVFRQSTPQPGWWLGKSQGEQLGVVADSLVRGLMAVGLVAVGNKVAGLVEPVPSVSTWSAIAGGRVGRVGGWSEGIPYGVDDVAKLPAWTGKTGFLYGLVRGAGQVIPWAVLGTFTSIQALNYVKAWQDLGVTSHDQAMEYLEAQQAGYGAFDPLQSINKVRSELQSLGYSEVQIDEELRNRFGIVGAEVDLTRVESARAELEELGIYSPEEIEVELQRRYGIPVEDELEGEYPVEDLFEQWWLDYSGHWIEEGDLTVDEWMRMEEGSYDDY